MTAVTDAPVSPADTFTAGQAEVLIRYREDAATLIASYEGAHADGHECRQREDVEAIEAILEAGNQLALDDQGRAILLAADLEAVRHVAQAEEATDVLKHVLGLNHARKGWLPNDVSTFVVVLLNRVLGEHAGEFIDAAASEDDLTDPRVTDTSTETVNWSYERRPWEFWRGNPAKRAVNEILELVPVASSIVSESGSVWLRSWAVEVDVPEQFTDTAWRIFARRGGWAG